MRFWDGIRVPATLPNVPADAKHVLFDVGIEMDRRAQEVVDGAGRFDAGETAAGNHHGQHRLALDFVGMIVGDVQGFNYAIPQEDGIAQCLHGQVVLFDTGCAVEVRNGAEGQYKVVVGDIEGLGQMRLHDANAFAGQVDRLDLDDQHPGAAQHFSEGLHDVGNGYVARGNLVQHRGKEYEILLRRQQDFDVGEAAEAPLQVQRRIGACKASAENQNALLHGDSDPALQRETTSNSRVDWRDGTTLARDPIVRAGHDSQLASTTR